MSRLTQALDKSDREEQRTNPVIDAELTQYIKEHSERHERLNKMPKAYLIRKLMLIDMKRDNYRKNDHRDIIDCVNNDPDLKARVEERVRNVPADRYDKAFRAAAEKELLAQTIQQRRGQGQPPPLPTQAQPSLLPDQTVAAPATAPAVASKGVKV